jgi:hypothetical protein
MHVIRRSCVLLLSVVCICCIAALGQTDRVFSIPLDDLKTWSSKAVVSLNAEISGHSKVHKLDSDCEMHLGAKVVGYRGDPAGWVLEPMNLCVKGFGGKEGPTNKEWEHWGDSLANARVRVEGVPRIWPEHLAGSSDASNPDHGVELHPLTRVQRGNSVLECGSFIFAPEQYEGGVSEPTARKILADSDVSVTEKDGMVDVDLQTGRIGNFTMLTVSFSTDDIEEVEGSHRMDGLVVFGKNDKLPARLLTVAGSDVNAAIARLSAKKHRRVTFDALVLFSLSPEALYKAAKQSNGKQMDVQRPIQLIVYGEPTGE